MANRKTKNNTQLQEEWIRRKYVVPVNIMESENNLIVENVVAYLLPSAFQQENRLTQFL